MRWHSIHVHYYGSDIEHLILEAVRPLFAAVSDDVTGAFFVRHWKRGPHVRLTLRTDRTRFSRKVLPTAREHLGDFLERRPSRANPDPERLLPLHERLAALEREDGPLLPWHPDNTLQVAPYDRRLHVLGSEAAADLLEDYLVATTEIAFAMTAQLRTGSDRLRLGFDLMVAVAHAFGGSGITQGFVSYRSHAEAFLYTEPDGARLREQWNELYRARADQLVDRVRAVVAATDDGSRDIPFVASWVAELRQFERRGHDLIKAGALSMDHPTASQQPDRPVATEGRSEFHRRMFANDSFMRLIRPSTWFATYRLLLNYTYVQLTRLGLTPAQRYLLCHLAANAVEDSYGVSAMDLIARRTGLPTEAGERR